MTKILRYPSVTGGGGGVGGQVTTQERDCASLSKIVNIKKMEAREHSPWTCDEGKLAYSVAFTGNMLEDLFTLVET